VKDATGVRIICCSGDTLLYLPVFKPSFESNSHGLSSFLTNHQPEVEEPCGAARQVPVLYVPSIKPILADTRVLILVDR